MCWISSIANSLTLLEHYKAHKVSADSLPSTNGTMSRMHYQKIKLLLCIRLYAEQSKVSISIKLTF